MVRVYSSPNSFILICFNNNNKKHGEIEDNIVIRYSISSILVIGDSNSNELSASDYNYLLNNSSSKTIVN